MKTTYISFAIIIIASFFPAHAARLIQRPKSLAKGDKIALISPASLPDRYYVSAAEKVLHKWGYNTVIGDYALLPNGSYAGSAEQRLADFLHALRDPSVKAIMCTRGGYGSIKELCRIPLDTLAKYPKWLIGYSDVTAIHSALVSSGTMSIHAHMCEHLAKFNGADSCSKALKDILEGKLPKYVVPAHPFNHTGYASGTLVGGNISVFSGLAGSNIDFLNSSDDLILFVEDVSERITSIDRLFHLLKIRGVLSRIKGLIIGQFTDYRPDSDFSSMYDMIYSIVNSYKIPIAFNFPVGHVDKNFPMIEGSKVSIAITSSETTLQFLP